MMKIVNINDLLLFRRMVENEKIKMEESFNFICLNNADLPIWENNRNDIKTLKTWIISIDKEILNIKD